MRENRRLRRGAYLLPTCFTIANLFCGFFSVVEASRDHFSRAAILVVVAGILDGLDGRIARLTGTTSEFGLEFDSLADIVSFGVAPGFLAYRWALLDFGRIGWLIAFLYVICAAMRLARFNIQHAASDKRYFVGLPSPPAAGVVASVAFAFPSRPSERWAAVSIALLVALVAALMVSRIRYRSFKDFDLKSRRSYIIVLPLAAGLVAFFTHPRGAFLTAAATYMLSGIASHLLAMLSRFRGRAAARDTVASAPEEVHDGTALR